MTLHCCTQLWRCGHGGGRGCGGLPHRFPRALTWEHSKLILLVSSILAVKDKREPARVRVSQSDPHMHMHVPRDPMSIFMCDTVLTLVVRSDVSRQVTHRVRSANRHAVCGDCSAMAAIAIRCSKPPNW